MSSFTLDVRVLRSFASVVETGSITETARRLGRTQPAITLQMKRLEDLTGRSCSSRSAGARVDRRRRYVALVREIDPQAAR
jgi:DNA-binding transcriptional LysR family regulator